MFFTKQGSRQDGNLKSQIYSSEFTLQKGAIAQLVERLLCKQDVDGSNPSGSTMLRFLRELRMAQPDFVLFGNFRLKGLREGLCPATKSCVAGKRSGNPLGEAGALSSVG